MNIEQSIPAYARRIESELRSLGVWQTEPLPDEAFQGTAAFLADTMTFYQWIQFILLDRLRQVESGEMSLPGRSMVGAYAVRELDGLDEAGPLVSLLSEFDAFIEREAKG